jgi:multidrug efflux pump subunit AcrA (membrane-fusion protein)
MLNISKNNIEDISRFKEFQSYQMTLPNRSSKKRVRIMLYLIVGTFLFLFLPWTQNIRSKGYVTALRPDQRPQTVHSIIPGRIEQWYVQEGDFVQKGDTILRVSEVKDEYFDPLLLERTREQADAKRFAAQSYADRVNAQKGQMSALSSNRLLRKEQAENRLRMAELKVVSDSIRLEQAKINYEVGVQQLARAETLFEGGLRSLTDLEKRRLRFQ